MSASSADRPALPETERRPAMHAFVNGPFTMPRAMRTERLWLMPFGMHLAPVMAAFHADEESNRYMAGTVDAGGSFARLAALCGQWSMLGFGFYALLDRRGAFVGFAGLNAPIDWPDLEIGYALMPDARGNGYAAEAVRAIRAEAGRRGAPPLVSYIAPENEASLKLARKLGAEDTGEIVLRGSPARVLRHPVENAADGAVADVEDEIMIEASAMPLTIASDGMTLRHPGAQDFEAYAAMLADPGMHFVGGPFTRSESWRSLAANVGSWALRGYGVYVIDADGFAGFCGLGHPLKWPEPELVYTLAPHARGRGIASAAARAVRTVAAEQGLGPLVSYIHPQNARSLAVAKRLGAVPEGALELGGETLIAHRHPLPTPDERPIIERFAFA